MNEHEAFMEGAKSGYSAGKGRAGSYIIGEEIELAWDAVREQCFYESSIRPTLPELKVSREWENGYKHGYLLAAEGSPLMDWLTTVLFFPNEATHSQSNNQTIEINMNTHRLEVLRDYLRVSIIAHTPGRFNLATWAGNPDHPWEGKPDLSCGTSACAVGLATTIPEFAAAGLKLEPLVEGENAGLVYMDAESGHTYYGFHAVQKFFDISASEANRLFSVGSYDSEELTTADEVADRIQAFLDKEFSG